MPDLTLLARRHKLPLVTIEELVSYRMRTETLVRLDGEGMIPTEFGPFELRTYESLLDGTSHVALTYGDPVASEAPLVRVHSECVTGDAFGSLRCDCGMQLQLAMKRIAEAGQGAIVYLRGHEGRGVGLPNKLRAYQLQDGGADTVEANLRLGLPVDARDYSIGAHILRHLGLDRVRLMTNNPAKVVGLERCGMQVASTVPLETAPTPDNLRYLAAKRAKMGHRLNLLAADGSGVRANGAAPGKRPKVPAGGAYG